MTARFQVQLCAKAFGDYMEPETQAAAIRVFTKINQKGQTTLDLCVTECLVAIQEAAVRLGLKHPLVNELSHYVAEFDTEEELVMFKLTYPELMWSRYQ